MSFAHPPMFLRLVTSRYTHFFCVGFLLMATAVVISRVQRRPSSGPLREMPTAPVLPAALLTESKAGSSLLVGIFRDDGVIVPFAEYRNREWSNPWGITTPEEPKTIADLPYPWYQAQTQGARIWQLVVPSETGQTATTSKTVQVASHCQEVWALPSDYAKARKPEPNSWGENLGIALNQPANAGAIERVSRDSLEWMRVKKLVGTRFDRAEAAGLRKVLSKLYLEQIPPEAQRKKVPLSLLNLYQARLDDHRTIFFFEANKEYPQPASANDTTCNNMSLFIGWIVQERDQLTILKTYFASTNCDQKEGGPTQPLAVIHLDGKVFAIVVEYGWEGESYAIVEIGRRRLIRVLDTYAGSC